MKKNIMVSVVTGFFLVFAVLPFAHAYTVSQTWGAASEGSGLILNTPVALGLDGGIISIADMGNHRIVEVQQDGSVVAKHGSLGTGSGNFDLPFGVVIDNDGNILVADTANYRIQKFDYNWGYLTQWGSYGTGSGQFGLPREIAVDRNNYYHVTDEFNDRVQVFDSNGSYLYEYGQYGTGNGEFRLPQGIAIDTSGSSDIVYVADTYNNRIQILTATGTYISQIGTGTQGDGNYTFYHPRGVNVDTSGNVFIADTFNHKVKKYDSAYSFKYYVTMGMKTEPLYPNQVKPLNNGYFTISDTANSQLLLYQEDKRGRSASLSANIGTQRTMDGVFSGAHDGSVDSSGDIYISDSFNHRIQKFDSNGNLLAKWGKNGGAGGTSNFGIFNGQFNVPRQIWVDKSNGKVYVADAGNNRIQVFNTSGTFLTKFGIAGSGNGQFDLPVGVCVDSSGNVFVADTMNDRVQKFDSGLTYQTQWGTTGMNNGQFREPMHIAVDSNDNVFVVDRLNNRVQKFSNNGTFLAKWGSNGGVPHQDPLQNWGTGNGDLFLPIGIEIDSNDYVFVTDTSNNRMEKFDSSGNYILQFGIFSGTSGNFFSPQGLGIDSAGNLYIPDSLLNRVQVFSP